MAQPGELSILKSFPERTATDSDDGYRQKVEEFVAHCLRLIFRRTAIVDVNVV